MEDYGEPRTEYEFTFPRNWNAHSLRIPNFLLSSRDRPNRERFPFFERARMDVLVDLEPGSAIRGNGAGRKNRHVQF